MPEKIYSNLVIRGMEQHGRPGLYGAEVENGHACQRPGFVNIWPACQAHWRAANRRRNHRWM